MSRQSTLARSAIIFTASTAVVGATFLGAAPAQAALSGAAVPAVQVQDAALVNGFDLIGLDKALLHFAQQVLTTTGWGELTPAALLTDHGLGEVTPNEVLSLTGLGHATLGDLTGFRLLGDQPVSLLLATLGLSDTTTLGQLATQLGADGQPISNLWSLVGLTDASTLGQTVTTIGLGGQHVSDLWSLVGLTDTSTLLQTADTLGIGTQSIDTLLGDWGVGSQGITGFLAGLDVTPSQLMDFLALPPGDTFGGIYDPNAGTFTAGTTVQQFTDAAGLGNENVNTLLATPGLGDAELADAATRVGITGDDDTVTHTLAAIGMNGTSLSGFLSGLGLGTDTPIGDVLSAVGLNDTTIGGLLGSFGLGDSDTVKDLVNTLGFGDTTLSGLVSNLGIGDDHLADLATSFYGTDTLGDLVNSMLASLGT